MSNREDGTVDDDASTTTRSVAHRALAVLLAVCVVGRGAYALYLVHSNAIVTDSGDAPTYLGPARQLLEHGRFNSGDPTSQSEFLRTPGYPAFLAAVFRVFGQTISSVLLVQVALSAVTVLLVYLLATRMWSVQVGVIAAVLTVLEPLQNSTSATILTESLTALLLMTAALVGFIAFTDAQRRIDLWALLGLILACAALVRPALYYLPLFVVLLLLVRGAAHERRRGLLTTVPAFLFPLVVLVGGWQLRNHAHVGSWRFSGIEAKNLYRFRAAGVVADTTGISFRDAQHELSRQFGPLGAERQGPYYARMYRAGTHILFAHPADTLLGVIRGLGSEVFSVKTKFFEYLGFHSVPGGVVLVAGALLVGFYAVCGYGVVLTGRRREALLAHVFVLGIAGYVLLTSAGPEAYGGRGERFRAPIIPILILYAALGTYTLHRQWQARRRPSGSASARLGSGRFAG